MEGKKKRKKKLNNALGKTKKKCLHKSLNNEMMEQYGTERPREMAKLKDKKTSVEARFMYGILSKRDESKG